MDDNIPLCAHCAEPINPRGHGTSVAMTSRNTCLLFHSECLADMHSRAYTMSGDMHQAVAGEVLRAMVEGAGTD